MTGDDSRCEGVRVLLPGATLGLGPAMARSLVAGGAAVVITGRDQKRADTAAEMKDHRLLLDGTM